jgi:hypothetical protein
MRSENKGGPKNKTKIELRGTKGDGGSIH